MSHERRYDDDEVRRIFDSASEAEVSAKRSELGRRGTGLTLSELQEIGSEVGIPPDLVAEAALALHPADEGGGRALVPEGTRVHRVLGVPLGVEREVRLPRNLTEDEWGRLVVDLRRIFSARGRSEVVGPVREWRNGNLYVGVAPEEGGALLSMGTRKGNVRPFVGAGAALIFMATLILIVMVATGEIAEAGAVFTPAFLGGLGAAFVGVNVVGLPSWARTRSGQLEDVGERALELTAGRAEAEPS